MTGKLFLPIKIMSIFYSEYSLDKKINRLKGQPMRKYLVLPGIIFFVLSGFMVNYCLAGQVVTDDLRQWAREVIAKERQIGTVAGKNTVAVLYFGNLSSDPSLDPLKKGIALMLITDLAKVKAIRVVERARIQAIFEEISRGKSKLFEGAGSLEAGTILGAGFIVGGDILTGNGEVFKIRSSLLQVFKEKMVVNPEVEGRLDDLFRLEKDILFALVDKLHLQLSATEKVLLKKPLSNNVDAVISLFKAIQLSDMGQHKDAAVLYEKAIAADPELQIAQDGLEELQTLGLISGGIDSGELLRSVRGRTSSTDQIEAAFPTLRSGSRPDAGDDTHPQPGTDGDLVISW